MADRLIDEPSVLNRISHGRSRLAELVQEGEFPRPIKLGRKKLWLESEVDAWIQELAKRHGKAAA